MCAPEKPSEKMLEVLIKLAREHYAPKVSVVLVRYRFNTERQKVGQRISSYVAALKRMASSCNFGGNLKEQLRDRFVCGVHNERIQCRLLQEGDDFTLERAVKLATSIETSYEGSLTFQRTETTREQDRGTSLEGRLQPARSVSNKRSGQEHFVSSPWLEAKCFKCGQKEHFRRKCQSKISVHNDHKCQRRDRRKVVGITVVTRQDHRREEVPANSSGGQSTRESYTDGGIYWRKHIRDE
ncbi:uncharacterized protein LOC135102524 [Scylla paramamosain]|uniref:uncharacterized protein LOC135102524 n=1 Tax=Scylla paramamosain TaxID=85552 RepID=UPI003083DC00